MARGKLEADWSRTSAQIWVVAEANRNPKKRSAPFSPDDFNPFRKRSRGTRLTKATFKLLKGVIQKGARSE